MTYPQTPGFQNTDTSKAAADLVKPSAQSLREQVLAAIRQKPRTSFELARDLGHPFEGIQPRTSELREMGLIEDSGARGVSRSPRTKSIVWQVVKPPEPPVATKQRDLF